MDAENKCIVILAGLPQLTQMLQRPQFEAFRQRITVKYQVMGLEYVEVHDYVREKLKTAGILDEVIKYPTIGSNDHKVFDYRGSRRNPTNRKRSRSQS